MSVILVIEDELSIGEFIADLLKDEQHSMMVASNGQEGLRLIAERRPDLIICDVMMPILDGRTFCQTVKADPVYAAIPMIMMSAGSLLSSDECNYAAFIYKPFNIDEFLAVISQVLNNHSG
jgi:two-component system, OmpR family, alkaline phosphatase synthesis response regulator PhoP